MGLLALAVQAFLGLAQRLASALAGAQVLGQLVAALASVELILATVDLGGLLEDLARDLPEVAVGVDRRVGRDLRAVDRHHPDRRQPRPRAETQHPGEHLAQRALVAAAELGDRRVIRRKVARDDAVGDVLHARALDPARRPSPARVGVKQQPDHHRRLVGRPAVTVGAVSRIERRQVQLADGIKDRPDQMPLRHPVAQRRRHQKHLITISTNEPHTHAARVPTRPDETHPFSRQPPSHVAAQPVTE